jgi:hypothetical protein
MIRTALAFSLLALLTPLGGCRSMPTRAPSTAPTGFQTISTESQRFLVHWRITPDPIPVNQPVSLQVRIERHAAAGRPIEWIAFDFDGGMPEHGHGFAYRPRVAMRQPIAVWPAAPHYMLERGVIGRTEFVVDDISFQMPGRWLVWFDITEGAITERAHLELNID